jgi:hypothetical protein
MSDHDSFLTRWSRRKRAAVEKQAAPDACGPETAEDDGAARPEQVKPIVATAHARPEPPFGLASLPSIESIGAGSNIRAFLAPGVPPELTRAALRRVWSTDPAIRDFVGLAENQWDFNAPAGVPGFGPYEITEEMKRLIADAIGGEQTDEEGTVPPAGHDTSDPSPQTRANADKSIEQTGAATRTLASSDDALAQSSSPDDHVTTGAVMLRHSNFDSSSQDHHPEKCVRYAGGQRSHGRALPE